MRNIWTHIVIKGLNIGLIFQKSQILTLKYSNLFYIRHNCNRNHLYRNIGFKLEILTMKWLNLPCNIGEKSERSKHFCESTFWVLTAGAIIHASVANIAQDIASASNIGKILCCFFLLEYLYFIIQWHSFLKPGRYYILRWNI